VTAALAACNAKTKIHYVRADDRSQSDHPYYFRPERLQSRASSIFGSSGQPSTAAAGFPYRFVFPANHPALSGPVYSEYQLQQPNQQQSEQLFSAEDLYTAPATTKQHPLSNHKHLRQYPQNQQFGYDFFGGGGGSVSGNIGGGKHQPYHLVKQPKHYQRFELAPSPVDNHQSPYSSPPVPPIAQPIMLLIPTSGQPGSPYQTLVLVPSSTNPVPQPPPQNPIFSGYQQPQMQQLQQLHAVPQFLQPGFITHPRGAPMMAGYPSNGLGKFPGTAQIIHRSHEPHHQQQTIHQQHKPQQSSLPQSPATSYQGSGSTHLAHAKTAGPSRPAQQPLEDKVSESTGASGENSDDRVDSSTETKSEEKKSSPEFGERTSTKPPPKRIVVT